MRQHLSEEEAARARQAGKEYAKRLHERISTATDLGEMKEAVRALSEELGPVDVYAFGAFLELMTADSAFAAKCELLMHTHYDERRPS
ncbi:hypothetical protein B0G84_5697 [Paraburkholderia sp. BL8N3]|nr:hypothetical protein [Paraburkholderia sp. BL8N3]TCK36684.1 hypothetical protein B0G84_5697 [Paraburkholderia sp. BL8N3]